MKRGITRRKFLASSGLTAAAEIGRRLGVRRHGAALASITRDQDQSGAKPPHSKAALNAADDGLLLWYDKPAVEWTDALPIGNGRLGAMVFGGTVSEQLQLNEDTLYAGSPYDPNNPEALNALPEARRLIFEG